MNREDNLIKGKIIADTIGEELKLESAQFFQKTNMKPRLSVVILGDDPAAMFYVRMIEKSCQKVNFDFEKHALSEQATEEQLLDLLHRLNEDGIVHGIIVQTPLPEHINEDKIREALSPAKDVDCFNPVNMGKLAMGNPDFLPCTPEAVFEILKRENIEVEGKHVVIVGRSSVVGKPLALILLLKMPHANATVTVCHSRTKDLASYTRKGDIVVAAAGAARLVKGEMIKDGTIVIDVGTNEEKGKLVGDVDFDEVSRLASRITPVPGGVGPVTNMMLMKNTLQAAERQLAK
ncbi:MAG: bifunctional 5,10-methylenetetrahydrofolate dehydrogenase/5,10-methenyltetrahydrofolate cyclohydrolase [Atribacterota bacterium]|nr:bifunctional 5,10-methylenetetrahydrofolate dehydrogenase/5,10-methenyltetrahydrofolate cyclohydrolase [Atribacterota bacterium]MDY0382733.1 bifunctional 5,10-methylenetetrahydrofolate dehydrogenase/5,10-methenyltetrahydrofolate cyclohydrolase [Atribacterota bacterium]